MTRQVRLAIFDFDGTLADSFPFFVSVFNQLAVKHRFDSIDLTHARVFRGYNARQMMQHVGMPPWKLPIVARSFMHLMRENSHRIALFDGTSEMLRHLDENGIQLAIVTANSRENVCAVLGKENMARIRHLEAGASIFGKASRITRVLGKCGTAAKDAMYIGDQVSDIEAAHIAKVAFGAVAWGYATIDALLAHQPEHVFHSIDDIRRLPSGPERPAEK